MNTTGKKNILLGSVIGVIPVIWAALITAPYMTNGLLEHVDELSDAFRQLFQFQMTENTPQTILIFLVIYAVSIGVWLSTRRNYRRGEEHGSAKWGDPKTLNKKYADRIPENNKLLTRNVRIGLNGRKHRRNLNVMVIGGSGAGKTRFYCKPNVMQCGESSLVILDPKGETIRATGHLLEEKGYGSADAASGTDLLSEIRSTGGRAEFCHGHGDAPGRGCGRI